MILFLFILLSGSFAFNIMQKLREEQYKEEIKKLNARLNQSRQKKTKQVKQVDTQDEKEIKQIMKYINVTYEQAKAIHENDKKKTP